MLCWVSATAWELDETLWVPFRAMPTRTHSLLVPALGWSSPETSPTVVSLPQHRRLPPARAVSTRARPHVGRDGREIKPLRWPGGDPAVPRDQREGPIPGSCVAWSHPQGKGQGQRAPLCRPPVPPQLPSAVRVVTD